MWDLAQRFRLFFRRYRRGVRPRLFFEVAQEGWVAKGRAQCFRHNLDAVLRSARGQKIRRADRSEPPVHEQKLLLARRFREAFEGGQLGEAWVSGDSGGFHNGVKIDHSPVEPAGSL